MTSRQRHLASASRGAHLEPWKPGEASLGEGDEHVMTT